MKFTGMKHKDHILFTALTLSFFAWPSALSSSALLASSFVRSFKVLHRNPAMDSDLAPHDLVLAHAVVTMEGKKNTWDSRPGLGWNPEPFELFPEGFGTFDTSYFKTLHEHFPWYSVVAVAVKLQEPGILCLLGLLLIVLLFLFLLILLLSSFFPIISVFPFASFLIISSISSLSPIIISFSSISLFISSISPIFIFPLMSLFISLILLFFSRLFFLLFGGFLFNGTNFGRNGLRRCLFLLHLLTAKGSSFPIIFEVSISYSTQRLDLFKRPENHTTSPLAFKDLSSSSKSSKSSSKTWVKRSILKAHPHWMWWKHGMRSNWGWDASMIFYKTILWSSSSLYIHISV